MKESPELTGSVRLRPARIGLVFKPSLETLSLAARYVTSAWGGLHFPFLDATNPSASLDLATRLDVDALYPIDESEEARHVASEPGFKWRGRGDWGPFNYSSELPNHLLGTDWILDEPTSTTFVMPYWEPAHPLDCLLSLWFGRYGDSSYELEQQARFMRRARPVEISRSGNVPLIVPETAPIGLTTLAMEYTGATSGSGVVMLDPSNPDHLIRFWNLRCCGANLFPWINAEADALRDSFKHWLDYSLHAGRFGNWRTGDGRDGGPVISVHVLDEGDTSECILRELEARKFTILRENGTAVPHGWMGAHPFSTNFEQIITVSQSRRGLFCIPVPRIGDARWHRGHQPGVVAADLSISSVVGLPPEWTMAVPGARRLVALSDQYRNGDMAQFCRPTDDGPTLAVRTDAHEVSISPVRTAEVFRHLMDAGPGWTIEQNDGGKFATQLVQMLGGAAGYVANQPAVREALMEAARSHNGRPIPALIQRAKGYQGAWPPGLAVRPHDDYPVSVVRSLLSWKVLQPALPVRCPTCTNETIVRPEDLQATFVCGLCESEAPLGLALGLKTRNEWLYRLAGNVPVARLTETLPVMATLSVLSTYRMRSHLSPYVLGVDVKAGGTPFEIDLIMALPERFPPLVVIGEVKSFRDPITAGDLNHLRLAQERLRNNGVECFILAATLRPEFDNDEVEMLRQFCSNLPTTLSPAVSAIMPIALTAKNLSVPERHHDHPMDWVEPGGGLAIVAIESCKRNLGLSGVEPQPSSDGWAWRCRWSGASAT